MECRDEVSQGRPVGEIGGRNAVQLVQGFERADDHDIEWEQDKDQRQDDDRIGYDVAVVDPERTFRFPTSSSTSGQFLLFFLS